MILQSQKSHWNELLFLHLHLQILIINKDDIYCSSKRLDLWVLDYSLTTHKIPKNSNIGVKMLLNNTDKTRNNISNLKLYCTQWNSLERYIYTKIRNFNPSYHKLCFHVLCYFVVNRKTSEGVILRTNLKPIVWILRSNSEMLLLFYYIFFTQFTCFVRSKQGN